MTRSIQETYLAAVTGKLDRYAEWLEHVPRSSAVTTP